MSARAIARMLLLACVAGCSFDFTDLPRDVPAYFYLEVVADSRTERLIMSAGIDPGHEIDGTRRTVLEDIRHGDVTIEPSHIDPDGTRMYETDWSLAEAVSTSGFVSVRAPVIEGLESIQQHPAPRVVLRAGPDSLFLTGDEPAILRIESGPPVEDGTVFWNVLLSDSIRGSHRNIQGFGSPPQEITIPRSWFDPQSQVYVVFLSIGHQQSGELILDRYAWTTIARSRIYWTVIFDRP